MDQETRNKIREQKRRARLGRDLPVSGAAPPVKVLPYTPPKERLLFCIGPQFYGVEIGHGCRWHRPRAGAGG